MKYSIIFFIFINFSFATTFSISAADGVVQAFKELDSEITKQNNELINKYKMQIQPLIEEIKALTIKNEILLKQIQNLEKNRLLMSQKELFLLQQELKLLDNNTNIILENK